MVLCRVPGAGGAAARRHVTVPRLEVRLDLVGHNTSSLVQRLGARGIRVAAVTKSTLGDPEVASTFLAAGVAGLADARLANVASLRRSGVRASVTLLRTPSPSEVAGVVEMCDASCNTEPEVLAALSAAAVRRGVDHRVVLMVELGDLREGIMPDDLVAVARTTKALPNLVLHGIGTNLACRSGVVPDEANMAELSALAALVEHGRARPSPSSRAATRPTSAGRSGRHAPDVSTSSGSARRSCWAATPWSADRSRG